MNSLTCVIGSTHTHTHTHTRLTALCSGLPRWAGTRKVKPIWISLKQETVSGSGISWAVCKSAPRSRQITTPASHHSVFTGRMPFLPPNQQRRITEGKVGSTLDKYLSKTSKISVSAEKNYVATLCAWGGNRTSGGMYCTTITLAVG